LSPRGSRVTEQNFLGDESASPNFNFLNKANNPFPEPQISIGDKRYEESPISVRQMDVPTPLSQGEENIIKMQGVIEEPPQAVAISDMPNRLSQSVGAVDNSVAAEPIQEIRETARNLGEDGR